MVVTVIGLMFGDEGKGHTVSELTRKLNASAVVRFSGGSQAAHRVVHNGKGHIFAQIGAGSAVSSTVKTYLPSQMAVDPLNLIEEIRVHHSNGVEGLFSRLFIDPECPLITMFHKAINQAREVDREEKDIGRISTTGLGVGEVLDDLGKHPDKILRIRDLFGSPSLLKRKIIDCFYDKKLSMAESGFWAKARNYFLRNVSIDEYFDTLIDARPVLKGCVCDDFMERLKVEIENGNVILEGSQGTLLDIDCGAKPYITRSKVTLSRADDLLKDFGNSERLNIGVIRAYATRHGLGPLPTESKELTELLPDPHNNFNEWQREFRCGWLDLQLLNYSVKCNPGLDGIVITNLDRLPTRSYFKSLDGDLVPTKPLNIPRVVENRLYSEAGVVGVSNGEESSWVWFLFPPH